MAERADITGQRFGRLVAVTRTTGGASWLCQCDCGNTTVSFVSYLRSGHTRSCGCLKRETSSCGAAARFTSHGKSQTLIYRLWVSIRQRCKTDKDYADKVFVCREWESSLDAFSDWAIANGWRKGLSLDRIDNGRGYSPDNCRFITPLEQARNKTNNKLTAAKARDIKARLGSTTQAALAQEYGVSKYTIYAIKAGKVWVDV
jgi:DNA-binding XRE family transcriptional regulator